GYRDDAEFLTTWDTATGQKVWAARVGPPVAEQPAMRWLSQRTPTVDGDRVYVVTARGQLVCFATADGTERWRKDYVTDYQGKSGVWGYCDFPLVDGERLICTPGGKDAAVVALDKGRGELAWKCPVPGVSSSTYCAIVPAEFAGVRQYVHQFGAGAVGIGTDGNVLWRRIGTATRSDVAKRH